MCSCTDLAEQLESVKAIETRRGLLKSQEGSSGDSVRAHDDLAFALAVLIDLAGPELGPGNTGAVSHVSARGFS